VSRWAPWSPAGGRGSGSTSTPRTGGGDRWWPTRGPGEPASRRPSRRSPLPAVTVTRQRTDGGRGEAAASIGTHPAGCTTSSTSVTNGMTTALGNPVPSRRRRTARPATQAAVPHQGVPPRGVRPDGRITTYNPHGSGSPVPTRPTAGRSADPPRTPTGRRPHSDSTAVTHGCGIRGLLVRPGSLEGICSNTPG
jgi:hypothetical protein